MTNPRARLLLTVAIALGAVGAIIMLLGPDNVWKPLGIFALKPHFADARVITAAAESYAEGYEVLHENPNDPWGRKLNYPRIWQLLFVLNLDQSDTTLLGLAFIALFVAGLLLLLWSVPDTRPGVFLLAALSPAVLFGIERANTDLVIFFLLSLAAFVAPRGIGCAMILIIASSILKLYPICGTALVLRSGRTKFIIYSILSLFVMVSYIILTYEDIRLISDATPRDADWSYGMNVISIKVARNRPELGRVLAIVSSLTALASLAYAATALPRPVTATQAGCDSKLDYFRMGAAIYSGTFMIGSNYDYKMVFLLMAVPQLQYWWSAASGSLRWQARTTLVALLISMWALPILKLSQAVPYGYHLGFILDEIANWTVFVGLLYLLCLTSPDWIKKLARLRWMPAKT